MGRIVGRLALMPLVAACQPAPSLPASPPPPPHTRYDAPPTATMVPPASVAPTPMPQPPGDARWILSAPLPPLVSTGDRRVDAYRDRLINHGDPAWRPIFRHLFAQVLADPAILAQADALAAIDTPAEHIAALVTADKIARGRALYRTIGTIGLERRPVELSVALWGALADYGKKPDHDLLTVLLVLAAHDRLVAETLFPIHEAAALVIHRTVPRPKLRGAANGRMGDAQMTPRGWRVAGVDSKGDGFVDIWDDTSDILATLSSTLPPGPREMVVAVRPERFDRSQPGEARKARALNSDQEVKVTLTERWDGKPWPAEAAGWTGVYQEPFGKDGPAYMITSDARSLAQRDPAVPGIQPDPRSGFALAVALLAEGIAGRPVVLPQRR